LATKDHFSSNCASWVAGGKSHEFVVALAGVRTGPHGIADDGVLIDARQAGGLADAAAVLEVLEDRQGSVVGEAGAEQGRALALGETLLAGAAGKHPALVWAIAEADAQIALTAAAVVGAGGVLAAEQGQLIHGDTAGSG